MTLDLRPHRFFTFVLMLGFATLYGFAATVQESWVGYVLQGGESSLDIAQVQRELDFVFGRRMLELVLQDTSKRYVTERPTVVVRFRTERPPSHALGRVHVVDGEQLGFIDVYSGRIREMLQQDTRYESRAVARVLAHEFLHIALGVNEHASAGVMRPVFTREDLITNDTGRFQLPPLEAKSRPAVENSTKRSSLRRHFGFAGFLGRK